jgi:hypothetical protein
MSPAPTNAQARLLAAVHDREHEPHGPRRFIGRGRAVWTHSASDGYFLGSFRVETTTICVRHGWLDIGAESEAWLTDAGVEALAQWRTRLLAAPPTTAPALDAREREILEMATRALELGYALAPRKPTRTEANRLRRNGWAVRCHIANDAYGLVPTPTAVVELRPDTADVAS